jgi:hypothetical protein
MTLELTLSKTGVFVPENKIGEGAIREVYVSGNLVLKVMKPDARISKKMLFGRASFQTQDFVRNRYGIDDFNRYEFEQYQKLMLQVPADLLDSFSRVLGIKQIQGRSTSIHELVTDADTSISRELKEHGPVDDAGFWERMDKLEQFFLEREILHLGFDERNIVVKSTADKTLPVIIDYKRLGKKVRPRTLGMLFSFGIRRKIKYKFGLLREKYQSKSL